MNKLSATIASALYPALDGASELPGVITPAPPMARQRRFGVMTPAFGPMK